jgi:putative membrane protein
VTESILNHFLDKKLAQPESDRHHTTAGGKNLGKGIVAGLIGGLVATAAKSFAERIYPPRIAGEPEPPATLADKLAGHELAPAPKAAVAESIHWAFGAAAGATYGAIAEFYPAATGRDGINFGMTLMAITHEGALPALGLAAKPSDQSDREKSSEMVTHVVFGLVAETVRRVVRSRI